MQLRNFASKTMQEQIKNFIPYIDLSSNRYKEVLITNLLDNETDVFNDAIEFTEKELSNRINANENHLFIINEKEMINSGLSKNIAEEGNNDIALESLKLRNSSHYLKEKYRVLAEMKIIYLYKCLEIKILRLLEIGFPDLITTDNFILNLVEKQFKTKGIDMKILTGYAEINELRALNNYLKHSGDLKRIRKTKEFETLDRLDGFIINLFHNRIKKKVDHFLEELAESVIENLNKG
jgi:hypothetical protein